MKLIKKFREPSGKLKFGEGHVSKAMSHQYDKENGISKVKMLPEVVYTLPGATRVKNYLKKQQPHRMFDVMQCATLANRILRNIGGYATEGDSWRLKFANLLLNGFQGMERPEKYTYEDLMQRNRDAASNFANQFDISTLEPDSVYIGNMFYNDTNYAKQAFREGPEYNGTHEGLIFNDGNQWKVFHGIGNQVYVDNLEDLIGDQGDYGITALLQPLYK